jgi:hypothetical protein
MGRFFHFHKILIESLALFSFDSFQNVLLILQLAVLKFCHKIVDIDKQHDYTDYICLDFLRILRKLCEKCVEQVLIGKLKDFRA